MNSYSLLLAQVNTPTGIATSSYVVQWLVTPAVCCYHDNTRRRWWLQGGHEHSEQRQVWHGGRAVWHHEGGHSEGGECLFYGLMY